MGGKKKPKKNKGKNGPSMAASIDRHILYEEAVQSLDFDLDLAEKLYRKRHKRAPRRLKEDFCGTAALATSWVRRDRRNEAWGVDLHKPTLDWGRRHHVAHLDEGERQRLHLEQGDVLATKTPPADVLLCLNFSCFVFKDRPTLRAYFEQAHRSLDQQGIMMMDVFGGQQAMSHMRDRRKIPKTKRADGLKVPKYTYIWDQARFNAITHDITCHIHFRFSDGSRIDKAFTYHWRLWTVPELRELLQEAGFSETEVYLHGWDEDGESDDVYRRRTYYENELAWVAYIVAYK